MKAQGEKRGHLTQTDEPEAQYGGGDAAALAADSEVARRTIAHKAYRDRLASLNLHERWEGGRLVGFTSAVLTSTWVPAALAWSLVRQRHAALGY